MSKQVLLALKSCVPISGGASGGTQGRREGRSESFEAEGWFSAVNLSRSAIRTTEEPVGVFVFLVENP